MNIKPQFIPGQFVYLITDPEQYIRYVDCVLVYDKFLKYRLICADYPPTDHFVGEISDVKLEQDQEEEEG
jgi:hypothetical protein